MSEPQEKILAYDNQFHEFLTQEVTGVECVSTPLPFINNGENSMQLVLSGQEIRELVSSIQVGAEWAYPDKSQQILFNFMKGLICSPQNPETGCVKYLPSASFIKYFPDNPYIANDKSAGWNKEAWFVFPTFDTLFPDWLDNWLNGAITSLTNYEPTDVLFNLESLPIQPIDAFLNGGGILPKIEIRFNGTGEIDVTLLSFPLGGKAVIELDNEPNVLDILTGGIIDPASFIVELNRDILSFPPDEYPIVQFPLAVETAGEHVLYIVFVPTLDDSLLPVGFGGGFRSIELCGFSEGGVTVGIEQIVWDGCQLKTITNGVETVVVTSEQIEACLDIPSGGGGGGGVVALGATYNVTPSANATTTSTSYVALNQGQQNHTFTKANALIGVGWAAAHAVAQSAFLRPSLLKDSVRQNGVNLTEARGFGTSPKELWAWDYFEDITLGVNALEIEGKTSSGTASFLSSSDVQWVVIEFDEISSLFVEDIRIFEGELQKKISGVWIAVSDSFEAIIASLQSQVSAAAANAAAAVNTANNALSVAQGAVNVNNTQNTRLGIIEGDIEDLELDAAAQAVTLSDHESRIDALEAASGASSPYLDGGAWSADFTWSDADETSILPFVKTDGFFATLGIASNFSPSPNKAGVVFSPLIGNGITHIAVKLVRLGHTNPMLINVDINGITSNGLYATFDQEIAEAGEQILWMRVPNLISNGIIITAQSANSDRFYLRGLRVLGRGVNPFI